MSVGLTEEHGAKAPKGWRQRLGHAMEHHYAHAAILCLIFLDVGAVLCEVMIRNVCVAPPAGSADEERLHEWGEGLSWASRSILFVLLLHLVALMAAFGAAFFKKAAYVIDLLIVCVALGLEMAHLALELRAEASHGGGGASHLGAESEGAHDIPAGLAGDGGALIIVLLCWRVVRIIHGFAVTGAAHTDEQELNEAKERIAALEKELAAVRAGGGTVESARVLSALRNSAPPVAP